MTTSTIRKPAFHGGFSMLTRTRGFRRLSAWAFHAMDADGSHRLRRQELHSGILLVHLQLAKYAGAAACYPPKRAAIDKLFDTCDSDGNGTIDEEEFTDIVVICCAQITSRIAVYYAIIILFVPVVANQVVSSLLLIDDTMGWKHYNNNALDKGDRGGGAQDGEPFLLFAWFEGLLTWNRVAENVVSLSLFMFLVPMFFNWIDRMSGKSAERTRSASPVQDFDVA